MIKKTADVSLQPPSIWIYVHTLALTSTLQYLLLKTEMHSLPLKSIGRLK